MKSSPLVLILLAACTSSATDPGFSPAPALEEGVIEGSGPDLGGPRAVVLSISPLIPGDVVEFTVTGANPGEQVHIARSTAGVGAGPCLGAAGLLCLDITSPALHGSVIADASGVAVLSQTLPASLSIGADVWFQTIIARGASGAAWVKSPEVGVQIEDAALNRGTLAAGDLVITEVMQNPAAVPDAEGEWFEVYNPTELDANLAGLEFTDLVSDSFTVADNVFLAAGERVVLGRNGDPTLNGGVDIDYAYANMDLGNGVDEIHILAGATFVDSVTWDDGISFPDPTGASMELHRLHLSASGNDAGVNWAQGTEPFGLGDLGTPGADNSFQPPLVGLVGTTGVLSGDDWVVCRADTTSAWVNADTVGEYNAELACQHLGYATATDWGGTGGTVCDTETFSGAGGSDPSYIAFSVHWLCE